MGVSPAVSFVGAGNGQSAETGGRRSENQKKGGHALFETKVAKPLSGGRAPPCQCARGKTTGGELWTTTERPWGVANSGRGPVRDPVQDCACGGSGEITRDNEETGDACRGRFARIRRGPCKPTATGGPPTERREDNTFRTAEEEKKVPADKVVCMGAQRVSLSPRCPRFKRLRRGANRNAGAMQTLS